MTELSERLTAFAEPLSFIKNNDIKRFALMGIEILPDYFFKIPASSSGKFHPSYSLGEGGLLRHTISACRIAVEIFRTDLWDFTDDDKDVILVSIMLHDGWKSGIGNEAGHTVSEHPVIATSEMFNNSKLMSILPPEINEIILNNIASHMGKWNIEYKTKVEFAPKPSTEQEKFVHLCDYIASRKSLEMNFSVPISPE